MFGTGYEGTCSLTLVQSHAGFGAGTGLSDRSDPHQPSYLTTVVVHVQHLERNVVQGTFISEKKMKRKKAEQLPFAAGVRTLSKNSLSVHLPPRMSS
jgi:hypothetical protein